MQLNLPIYDRLAACNRILIAGMGGGFDIFCGLPLYLSLQERGHQVHLANLTFSPTHLIQGPTRLSSSLVGVTADTPSPMVGASPLINAHTGEAEPLAGLTPYFPEHYLARWFRKRRSEEISIWCFDKVGVRPLIDDYRRLIAQLSIDGLVLIDGGVDSLVRGDEAHVGTFIEDAVSLAAVSVLDELPVRLLCCLGLGAEQDIAYAHIFENIAALAASGDFLGSCALLKQMPVYQAFEDAVLYVQGMPLQDPSVINSSIVSAIQGYYGDYHLTQKTHKSTLWISPLMALYWFFEASGVVGRSLLMGEILTTESFQEAMRALMLVRRRIPQRSPRRIPLP